MELTAKRTSFPAISSDVGMVNAVFFTRDLEPWPFAPVPSRLGNLVLGDGGVTGRSEGQVCIKQLEIPLSESSRESMDCKDTKSTS